MIDFNSALRQSTLAASTMWAVGTLGELAKHATDPEVRQAVETIRKGLNDSLELAFQEVPMHLRENLVEAANGLQAAAAYPPAPLFRIADLGEVRLVDAARLEMLTHPLGEGALLEPDGAEAPARNDVALDPRAAERNEQFADLVIGDCVWVAKNPLLNPTMNT